MGRGVFRLVLFFLCFSVEVRIHAAMMWEPKACEKMATTAGTSDCVGLAVSELSKISLGDTRLRLLPKSVVKKSGQHELTLVTGTLLVDTEKPLLVKHLFGDVQIENATVILVATNKALELYPVKNSIVYRPRGASENYSLDTGYSQILGRVDRSGVARMLLPKPASVDVLVSLWASLTLKSENERLATDIRAYRAAWKVAVDTAGPWYQDLIQRQIASLNDERERERLRQIELKKEENFLREMFKRRNLIE